MTEHAQPTRAEHLNWCKQRAREYLDMGEVSQAITSFMSDLSKHPDTQRAVDVDLARFAMQAAVDKDASAARRFIEGLR